MENLGAWVSRHVLKKVCEEAHSHAPRETGGILMGYWADTTQEVVVTNCIGPGPGAIHSRDGFSPDHEHQEKEIARVYRESGCLTTYLGDWHSHPNERAYLSIIDKTTLFRITSFQPARAPNALMAVMAGGDPWELSMFRGSRRRSYIGIRKLKIEPLRIYYF